MTNENNKNISKLKYYHILILECIFSSFLLLNSNYVNNKRNKEKNSLPKEIISNRKLEADDSEPLSDVDKICARGTEDLVKYYQTADLSLIDIDKGAIKSKEKDKPYFKSLINIIRGFMGDDVEEDDEDEENEGDGRRLRNLEFSLNKNKQDIINYGKHLLPILIFFAIGILCIPGWLICCFCCCCNCCCCCCCKKPGCKLPCFIFTYIFYGLSVGICIYGLTQSNKIFVGLSDTECSILKFFDQFLDGETKQEKPRWPGIAGINEILESLKDEINLMKTDTVTELRDKIDAINVPRQHFLDEMETSSENFYDYDTSKFNNNFLKIYNSYNFDSALKVDNSKEYVLDLVKMFGIKDPTSTTTDIKYIPKSSTLYAWKYEYSLIADNADEYMNTAKTKFSSILDDNVDELIGDIREGQNQLEDLKKQFNDIKGDIEKSILDYSDTIDKYGKLGFKLVFGVLCLWNVVLAVLVLLICFCSGKMCTGCCCCRCIFKLFTHLFWNILVLLTIISFFVGFIFSFIGQIGSDAMSVISFVVSVDNTENLITKKLGENKKYLDICINDQGDIIEELGLNTKARYFDEVYRVEGKIKDAKNNFTDLINNPQTYKYYLEEFKKRDNLTEEKLIMIPADAVINDIQDIQNLNGLLNFHYMLKTMNESISNAKLSTSQKDEKWNIDSNSPTTCNLENVASQDAYSSPLNPKKCKPFYRNWIYAISNNGDDDSSFDYNNIKARAKVITDIIESLDATNYETILNSLKNKYENFLGSYVTALDFFNTTIGRITNKIKEFTGEGNGLFGFVKCDFIATNLKILLKYLKSSLGSDIYTIGICLYVVGCSLILSISSTILLIVVINISIDKNKKEIEEEKKRRIEEYPLNTEGRIIKYQN